MTMWENQRVKHTNGSFRFAVVCFFVKHNFSPVDKFSNIFVVCSSHMFTFYIDFSVSLTLSPALLCLFCLCDVVFLHDREQIQRGAHLIRTHVIQYEASIRAQFRSRMYAYQLIRIAQFLSFAVLISLCHSCTKRCERGSRWTRAFIHSDYFKTESKPFSLCYLLVWCTLYFVPASSSSSDALIRSMCALCFDWTVSKTDKNRVVIVMKQRILVRKFVENKLCCYARNQRKATEGK